MLGVSVYGACGNLEEALDQDEEDRLIQGDIQASIPLARALPHLKDIVYVHVLACASHLPAYKSSPSQMEMCPRGQNHLNVCGLSDEEREEDGLYSQTGEMVYTVVRDTNGKVQTVRCVNTEPS